MKQKLITSMVLILLLAFIGQAHAQLKSESYGQGTQRFSLATGSPGELGLVKALAAALHS